MKTLWNANSRAGDVQAQRSTSLAKCSNSRCLNTRQLQQFWEEPCHGNRKKTGLLPNCLSKVSIHTRHLMGQIGLMFSPVNWFNKLLNILCKVFCLVCSTIGFHLQCGRFPFFVAKINWKYCRRLFMISLQLFHTFGYTDLTNVPFQNYTDLLRPIEIFIVEVMKLSYYLLPKIKYGKSQKDWANSNFVKTRAMSPH